MRGGGLFVTRSSRFSTRETRSKRKRKKNQKRKRNLWKMPQPWKSPADGLRPSSLRTYSHRCLEKPHCRSAFPHFPQARRRDITHHESDSLRTIRGGCAIKESREAPLAREDGVVLVKRRALLSINY